MKKLIVVFSLNAVLICTLLSCGKQSPEIILSETSTAVMTEVTTVATTTNDLLEKKMTVDDVVAYYDAQVYRVEKYDSQRIASISEKLTLEGDITSVIYIINSQTSSPDLEWTYVYEFTDESDAVWMEENRRLYISSVEGGICIRRGSIVVYGNSDVIASIS